METINTRIKKIREECAGKNKDFAQIMGEKRNTVNNWVREGYSVGLSVILKIAEKFENVDLNWLLTGSGSMLKNISENSENLSKQSEKDSRNSIDEIIEKKIKKAIMENIPAIISAVMEGMNKQMEGQNQVINKQLDMLQEVIRSLADLNTKSDKIHENVVKLSRKAQ